MTPSTPLTDADLDLLLLIRYFELKLLDLFAAGLVAGTTHTCLGQEYVPVALRTLLDDADHVFSNHRGHGHYLARFGDCEGLLAEIMGREGGVCDGVGGSQHLLRDRFLSTGVQGQNVPVAVGAALRLKRTEPGRLAAVYVGDGTWGEGVVYEALNLASLWRVPLLVVVENNGIAQSTPTGEHLAGSIALRARAFGVDHHPVTGCDVETIRSAVAPLVERVRRDNRPLVLEFHTARLGPHSKGDDTRPPQELDRLRAQDWLPRYAAAEPSRFASVARRQQALVERIADEVSARRFAT